MESSPYRARSALATAARFPIDLDASLEGVPPTRRMDVGGRPEARKALLVGVETTSNIPESRLPRWVGTGMLGALVGPASVELSVRARHVNRLRQHREERKVGGGGIEEHAQPLFQGPRSKGPPRDLGPRRPRHNCVVNVHLNCR